MTEPIRRADESIKQRALLRQLGRGGDVWGRETRRASDGGRMRLHAVRCVSLVWGVGALHDGGACGQLGGLQVALGGPCGPLEVPEGPCHPDR